MAGESSDDVVLRIANEFADVQVRVVHTRNGARLEIASPRRGHTIQLCPVELEALSAQPKSLLSLLLSLPPAGPDEADG
jgi:hypothetical protein